MSGIGTVRLRSGIKEREIVFATYENEVTSTVCDIIMTFFFL